MQTNLLVTLQKTVTAAVTSTKNVTLYLRGSDPLAGPPVWRVAEELPSWITLQVEQASDPFDTAAFDPDEFDEGRSGEEVLALKGMPYETLNGSCWDASL